jgi:hypothetical protein
MNRVTGRPSRRRCQPRQPAGLVRERPANSALNHFIFWDAAIAGVVTVQEKQVRGGGRNSERCTNPDFYRNIRNRQICGLKSNVVTCVTYAQWQLDVGRRCRIGADKSAKHCACRFSGVYNSLTRLKLPCVLGGANMRSRRFYRYRRGPTLCRHIHQSGFGRASERNHSDEGYSYME